MNADTLAETLSLHQEWLNDPEKGKRAYLSGTDLSEVCHAQVDSEKKEGGAL